jgi:hypothetical protein
MAISLSNRKSRYKKGYKYRSVGNDSIQLPIQLVHGMPFQKFWNDERQIWYCGRNIEITLSGVMTLRDGYSWDGCSGPAINRKENHRAGKFHDGLYECIRNGVLEESTWRPIADQVFRDLCIEDGMWKWLAQKEMQILRMFGHSSATKLKKIYEAP